MSNSEHTFDSGSNPHGLKRSDVFCVVFSQGCWLNLGLQYFGFSNSGQAINFSVEHRRCRVPISVWHNAGTQYDLTEISPRLAVVVFSAFSEGTFNCIGRGNAVLEPACTVREPVLPAWEHWQWLGAGSLLCLAAGTGSCAGMCMCMFKSHLSFHSHFANYMLGTVWLCCASCLSSCEGLAGTQFVALCMPGQCFYQKEEIFFQSSAQV